jgi:hypothetical protein
MAIVKLHVRVFYADFVLGAFPEIIYISEDIGFAA